MTGSRDVGGIRLAPNHDPSAYAKIFKQHQRIHIPGILRPESASTLHAALANAEFESLQLDKGVPLPALSEAAALLASPEFKAFVAKLTDRRSSIQIKGQATRYTAQSALKDLPAPPGSYAGFEITLTRGWRADWGGVLAFLDPGGNITITGWIFPE
jgi:hypothetical protein